MPEELSGAAERKQLLTIKNKITQMLAIERMDKGALTAVDGQIDVAVLCPQEVGGRAAIQAGCLRGHVDNLD